MQQWQKGIFQHFGMVQPLFQDEFSFAALSIFLRISYALQIPKVPFSTKNKAILSLSIGA